MKILLLSSLAIIFASLFSGCASSQYANPNYETDIVFAEGETPITNKEILRGYYRFMKKNEGRKFELLEISDIEANKGYKPISFYVQGGPFPGKSRIHNITFDNVRYDENDEVVYFDAKSKSTWNRSPVMLLGEQSRAFMEGSEVRWEMNLVSSWMVVGTSVWNVNCWFRSINESKLELKANWTISGVGPMTLGGGGGYMLIKGR